jgi:hypothetical protein
MHYFTAIAAKIRVLFYVGTTQRICLLSDDFYSDSTLILTIAMK